MGSKVRGSRKLNDISDSIFPEMTRLAQQYDAVNLSQGFPDFPAPDLLKQAACDAIQADDNQYSIAAGSGPLREAVANHFARRHQVTVDPEQQVTICCGSTEAMLATMLACVDPGDEVIVFEPFYENYGPGAVLSGASPKYVQLVPPTWAFDRDRLADAFSDRTRAIVINTPTNPTGKVFSRDELSFIADLCQRWDVIAISDEIYEHIVFDDAQHVPIASLPGMADRTVTISGLSKTYSVTGWRIGWAIAPRAADRGDPQDARLSHRGGADAVAARRRDCAHLARRVLPVDGVGVSAAARPADHRSRRLRLRVSQASRGVLLDGRCFGIRIFE